MTLTFISKQNTGRLILIFAGWSTDARLFTNISATGWDVAVVHGDDFSRPDWHELEAYPTIYLYAWSMGVYFAEKMLPVCPTICYAVNGTPWPCDDEAGIPRVIFEGTAAYLTPANLDKFRMRMCGGVAAYREKELLLCGGDVQKLRQMLVQVAEATYQVPRLPWKAAYISREDRIFPTSHQEKAWRGIAEIRWIDGSHLPDFADIVAHTVIDVENVALRFERSNRTYTDHAHAQRIIATKLAEMLAGRVEGCLHKVIEIGSGTGLFTRAWSRRIDVQEATFVDLTTLPRYNVAATENYIKGDAETLVERLAATEPTGIDAILSASAVQWFANLPRFFANARQLLKPGGLLAVSTFAPGNLPELHALRPDTMYYPMIVDIKSYLADYEDVEVCSEDIKIEFTTPIDALRHLRLTGVAGSGAKAGVTGLRRFAAEYPQNEAGRYTLTFKPVYILARRAE